MRPHRSWLLVAAAAFARALNPWPLEGTVELARQNAEGLSLTRPTGLSRNSYLETINGIVGFFTQFQAANGSIIDPYAHEEIQYATPTYASATSLLVATGYNTSLLETSALALDSALSQLSNGTAPQGHTNFFMFPIMMAFWNLKPLADAARVAQWEAWLRNINPAIYKTAGNWGLVAVGGEYLRTTIGGYGNASWWQNELSQQLAQDSFTSNGQYQDHSGMDGLNPVPYDTFPCKYMTVLLQQGFNNTSKYGPEAANLAELMRRSAWTHMLMQSPWGEIPTGGRSSQHQWNEAASAAIYEIQATNAIAAGDTQAACMFRRAARLSLASVRRWQNPAGDLQIVKNRFPPADRWGYEVYSFLSQYNLLPASQLATAYYFAAPDEDIPECATFADAGGFVFQLPEFNAIIANAHGTYAELELGSDPHYDSTGLHRVHINNCSTTPVGDSCVAVNPMLGPTAGPPQENGGLAIGPWWSVDEAGTVVSLANQTFEDVTAAVLTPAPNWSAEAVAFTVSYTLLDQGVQITEVYNVSAGGRIDVMSSASMVPRGNITRPTRFGITFPAFMYDGATNATIAVSQGANATTISVTADPAGSVNWGQQTMIVRGPAPGHEFIVSNDPEVQTVSRNGLVTPVSVEVQPVNTDAPSFAFSIVGSGMADM